jgi:hypothetical protein
MRCPKCSFTSFDHLVTCEKCGRDLTEIVGQLHGTSQKAESPLFLGPALKAAAEKETFTVSDGAEDTGPGLDREVDFSQAADTGAEDVLAAEEISLDREPDQAKEVEPPAAVLPDEVDLKLEMEGAEEETTQEATVETELSVSDEVQTPPPTAGPAPAQAAEMPAQVAEAEEEQTASTGLNFEGLDLSDLSPADDQEMEGGASGADEESPLDLWSLDTSGEDDLADLFDDLLPSGKPSEQTTAADDQPEAEEVEGGDPAEPAAAEDDQPEKDDG